MATHTDGIEAAARALCRFGTNFAMPEQTLAWVDQKWHRFKDEAELAVSAYHETVGSVTLTRAQIDSMLKAAYPFSTKDERDSTFQAALSPSSPPTE